MKSVLKWRHYCDHCKKAMGTKPAMVKHEAGCTLNPERTCSMCEKLGEVQLSMEALDDAYAKGFKALREACHECPACTLATLRQYRADLEADEYPIMDKDELAWDFKADCKSFWDNWNSEHNSRHNDIGIY